MAAATAALIKSGTTTLEAALAGTPSVVAYRASPSTYGIARRLMNVDRIGLVNLVADRTVMPEFWHLPVTVEQIAEALGPLLVESSEAGRKQREGLAQVVAAMGPGGAAARVADMVLEQLAP
jgi:lipid-A-disaccharide synthase